MFLCPQEFHTPGEGFAGEPAVPFGASETLHLGHHNGFLAVI
jgi:hypothetical protein